MSKPVQAKAAPLGGDAILIKLAELQTGASNAGNDYEHLKILHVGAAETYLEQQAKHCFWRSRALLSAICFIEAEGIDGALVQFAALAAFVDIITTSTPVHDEDEEKCKHALASIGCVLKNLASADAVAAVERLEIVGSVHDPFINDAEAWLETMKEYFAENSIALELRKPRRQEPA
jgi:hypothetical protein